MPDKTIPEKIRDSTLKDHIATDKAGVGLNNQIQKLLRDTQDEIVAAIAKCDPTAPSMTMWKKARLDNLNGQISEIVGKTYGEIRATTKAALTTIGKAHAKRAVDSFNKAVGVDVFNVTLDPKVVKAIVENTLIDGAKIGEWWNKQSASVKAKMSASMAAGTQALQIGMTQGESVGDLITRIRGTKTTPGIMSVTKREAEALVRTSVMQVSNAVRQETFKENADVLGAIEIIATLDNRTCQMCRPLDGKRYDLNGSPIDHKMAWPGMPVHFNCRCTIAPVPKSFAELSGSSSPLSNKQIEALDAGIPVGERASMDGPVSGELTYDNWLATQPEEVQIDILGQGRWKLWSENKLDSVDLVDNSGLPLSLKELQARLGDILARRELEAENLLRSAAIKAANGWDFAKEVSRLKEAEKSPRIDKIIKEAGGTSRFYADTVKTVEADKAARIEKRWAADMSNPDKVLNFKPGQELPETIFPAKSGLKLPLSSAVETGETEFVAVAGKNVSSGVIMIEEDGRVWIVAPKEGFGGYENTFAKGTLTEKATNLQLQRTAINETLEETGLHADITGWLGDYEKGTSKVRYYIGVRAGGSPAAMGAETEAVRLVPQNQLDGLLNRGIDKKIAKDLAKTYEEAMKYGGGDLEKGLSVLAEQKGSKIAFEGLMEEYGGIIKGNIPDDMLWSQKLQMAEGMIKSSISSIFDSWSTMYDTAEFTALNAFVSKSPRLMTSDPKLAYKTIKEEATKLQKAATDRLAKLTPAEIRAQKLLKEEGIITSDDSAYAALKRIELRATSLEYDAREELIRIAGADASSVERYILDSYSDADRAAKVASKGHLGLLDDVKERALSMTRDATFDMDTIMKKFGDDMFVKIQNEIALIDPTFYTKSVVEQVELMKRYGDTTASALRKIDKLLAEGSDARLKEYADRVPAGYTVDKRLLMLKEIVEEDRILAATHKSVAKSLGVESIGAGGKLLKDLPVLDQRLITGSFKKSLIGGKVPSASTKSMVAWESLASTEKRRIMDAWIRKGATLPDDFLKKYYGEAMPVSPKKVVSVVSKDMRLQLSDYVEYAPKEGSNPGGYFHAKDNPADRWYFKFPDDQNRVQNEILAGRLYQAAGVEVPDLVVVEGERGKIGVASRVMDGVEKNAGDITAGRIRAGIHENFVVDAWLANWDVVGGAYDNLLMKDGVRAVRIDVGGSLLYRARGGLKGSAFGNSVDELTTMMTGRKNPEAVAVFGKTTREELRAGAAKVLRIDDKEIKSLVEQFGSGTAYDKARLSDILIARKKYIQSYFADVDAVAKPVRIGSVELHETQINALKVTTTRGKVVPSEQVRFAQSKGLTGITEEKVKIVQKKLEEQITACINIRCNSPDSDVYRSLMREPVLKNQFVQGRGGSSGGSHCPYVGSTRDEAERILSDGELQKHPAYKKMGQRAYFETPEQIEAAYLRPVYGFVLDSGDITSANQYGSLTAVFKPEVKKRMTYTLDNSFSLRSGDAKGRHGDPKNNSPLFQALFDSAKKQGDIGNIDAITTGLKTVNQVGFDYRWGYIEAQIYGKTDLTQDVAYFVWRRSDEIPEFMQRFADRMGVKIYGNAKWEKMIRDGKV